MKSVIAIKECPQGQQPGEQFDVPDEHAAVLVTAGAAKYAEDGAGSARGRYRRRDLRADDGIETKAETVEP